MERKKFRLSGFILTLGVALLAATATAGASPVIGSIPPDIQAGAAFTIAGSGFTAGSVVNFFVQTSAGAVNAGPLKPSSTGSTQIAVSLSPAVSLGEGVAAVQVVNTDEGFAPSNLAYAQLQGNPALGIPTITGINGAAIDPTSLNPSYAVDVINTVVPLGAPVTVQGMGFDTVSGVAVDIFCSCPGGKAGPFILSAGDPGLTSSLLTFTIPGSGPMAPSNGPGSFRVTNLGSAKQSNSVGTILGERVTISSVSQSGCTIAVNGTGFSASTVINLFATQAGALLNLGGFGTDGTPKLPLSVASSHSFTFQLPPNVTPGAAFVEAFNPPYVPFTSSGTGSGGSFTLGSGCCASKVLLIGGDTDQFISSNLPATAELYDPSTQTFAKTAGQPTLGNDASGANTATVLPNGNVLVTGEGLAQLYRPQRNDFISAGTLLDSRHDGAVGLSNGNVLLFQIDAGGGAGTAEVYNWQTNSFSPVASSVINTIGAATLLNHGNVLLLGAGTAQLYRPSTNDTAAIGSILGEAASATRLDDLVLISEVGPAVNLPSTQLYSTKSNTFMPAGTGGQMSGPPVSGLSATRLDTGEVLLLVGFNRGSGTAEILGNAQLYEPSNDAFVQIPPANIPCNAVCDRTECDNVDCASERASQQATLLPNGQVLITGGVVAVGFMGGGTLVAPTDAWLYDPATRTFQNTAHNMTTPRWRHAAALICQ